MNKIVLINELLCIGCAKCVELCPRKILYIDKATQKCKVTDESKCDKLRGFRRQEYPISWQDVSLCGAACSPFRLIRKAFKRIWPWL